MSGTALFEEYDVDGLCYPLSMSGTTRRPGDPPLRGYAIVFLGNARKAFPAHPALNMPLDHPAMVPSIAVVAERYGCSLEP